MGHELYRMIRDGAPESWTPLMRLLAKEIADDALDPSQGAPKDGGWPQSKIPLTGRWATGDEGQHRWWDGLTERTGLSPRAISRILTELARADYEMREQIGTDKRGRPIFALSGRRRMTFRVPLLPPRKPPDPATYSTPDPATISTPDPATYSTPDPATSPSTPDPATTREVARSGSGLGRQNRHESTPDPATFYPPTNPLLPQPHLQVVNSYLEGDLDRQPDDDDFPDYETRPRRSPGLGQCTACGEWFVIAAEGRINRHNDNRPEGRYGRCPGARQPPVRPVRCTGCGRTGLALASLSGLCAACTRERKEAEAAEGSP